MKKLKAILSSVLVVSLLTVGLLGCSSKGEVDTKQNSDSVETDDGKIHLRFGVHSGYISEASGGIDWFNNTILAEYEKTHPNVDVELVLITVDSESGWNDYFTKLQTMQASGTAPDVFTMAIEGYSSLKKMGLCQPMNQYLDSHQEEYNEIVEDTIPALIDAYKDGDDIYGVGWGWGSSVIWLNTKLLEEAGLEIPDVNWDFDTFMDYCEKLTIKENGVTTQYGFGIPQSYFLYQQWLNNFGTSYLSDDQTEVTFDSDKSIELAQMFQDMVYVDGYAPVPDASINNAQLLMNGNIAMTCSGKWDIATYAASDFKDLAVVRVPSKYDSTTLYAPGCAGVSSTTQYYDEACEFALWCSSKFYESEFFGLDAVPGRYSCMKEMAKNLDYVVNYEELFMDIPKDGAKCLQASPAYVDMATIFDRYMSSIYANEMKAQDGIKAAAEEMKKAVELNPID